MLHGCFLYLTNNFLDKVGFLDENLFMYGEEDLMSWNCEIHGLKRIILPRLKVLHKDGQSTKTTYKEKQNSFVKIMAKKSNNYLKTKINKLGLLRLIVNFKSF